jgi:hypothetical protein
LLILYKHAQGIVHRQYKTISQHPSSCVGRHFFLILVTG